MERFRASPAHAAFLKRWNLPAYFSLRFQDVAGGLEGKLGASAAALQPAPPAAAQQQQQGADAQALHWAPSAALWAGLQRCVSEEVFLPQLADKFTRLALQLVARYAHWVRAGMQQRAEAAAAAAAGGQQQQRAAAQQQAAGGGEQQGGAASAAAAAQQGEGGDGGGGGSWEAAATPEQLAQLRQDVDALQSAVLTSFVPRLAALVAPAGEAAGEAVAAAFAEACEQLERAGGLVLEAVAAALTEKSVVVLKQVGGWRDSRSEQWGRRAGS